MGDHAPKLHGGRQPEEHAPKRTRTRVKRPAEPTQQALEEPQRAREDEVSPEPEQAQGES